MPQNEDQRYMHEGEKNKLGKTVSETKTLELLSSFFAPFPVFADPSYKMDKLGGELCDILVILPYATLVVQVKGAEETRRTPESWLTDKVYNKAAKQAEEAALRLHQGAAIFCDRQIVRPENAPIADIYPIAVFDEISPKKYYSGSAHGDLTVNLFDYDGLRDAINAIPIPREFVNYLEKRPFLFREEQYGTMYPVLPLKDEILITGSARQEVNYALRFFLRRRKDYGSKEYSAIKNFSSLLAAIKRCEEKAKPLLEFLACFDLETVLFLMEKVKRINLEKGRMTTDGIRDNTGRSLVLVHVPANEAKGAQILAHDLIAVEAENNKCKQCFVLGFVENNDRNLMVVAADLTNPSAAKHYRQIYEDYMRFLEEEKRRIKT